MKMTKDEITTILDKEMEAGEWTTLREEIANRALFHILPDFEGVVVDIQGQLIVVAKLRDEQGSYISTRFVEDVSDVFNPNVKIDWQEGMTITMHNEHNPAPMAN